MKSKRKNEKLNYVYPIIDWNSLYVKYAKLHSNLQVTSLTLSCEDYELYGTMMDGSKVVLLPNHIFTLDSETFPMFVSLFTSRVCVVARDTADTSLWLCIAFSNLTLPTHSKYLTKLLTYLPDLYPSLFTDLDDTPASTPDLDSSQNDDNDSDGDDNMGSELVFLYSCLHMRPLSSVVEIPPFLRSKPFPHQIQAVTWMLNREGVKISDDDERHFDDMRNKLHPLFVSWPADPSAYICLYNMVFSDRFVPTEIPRKGGVLCDTMGLVILHPRDQVKEEMRNVNVSAISSSDTLSNNTSDTTIKTKLEEDPYVSTRSYTSQSFKRDKQTSVSEPVLKKRRVMNWMESDSAYYEDLSEQDFLCVCGIRDNRNNDRLVQCTQCHRYQHWKCVFESSPMPMPASEYVCLDCRKNLQEKLPLILAKTTLVMMPIHISKQWINELQKHIQAADDDSSITHSEYEGMVHGIRYLLYPGINTLLKPKKRSRRSSKRFHDYEEPLLRILLFPEVLAQYDIIFLPYESFRADFTFFVSQRPTLRSEIKESRITSPLFCMEWWRVVLDEVHLVENSRELFKRCYALRYENLWCISGTPFNKNLSEMHGIMKLLQIPLFSYTATWKKCVEEPFAKQNKVTIDMLSDLISEYYWRTTFEDIQRLSPGLIPPQTRNVKYVHLSGIEKMNYSRVRERTVTKIGDYLNKISKRYGESFATSKLELRDLLHVLDVLKPLRQACNHYQVGTNTLTSFDCEILSLEQVRQKLIENSQQDCQNTLRNLVACRNAVAGLMILQGHVDQAAQCYSETLDSCKKWDELFVHTDSVQLIHCMYNMLCCEELKPGVLDASTVSDVRSRLDILENEFLSKPRESLDRSIAHRKTVGLSDQLFDSCFKAIHTTSEELFEGHLYDNDSEPRIESDRDVMSVFSFTDSSFNLPSPSRSVKMFMRTLNTNIKRSVHEDTLKIRSIRGTYRFLLHWRQALQYMRTSILEELSSFDGVPSVELINQCSICPRCVALQGGDKETKRTRKASNIPLCAHCKFESRLKLYDALILDSLPNDLSTDTSIPDVDESSARISLIGVALRIMLQYLFFINRTGNNQYDDSIQTVVNQLQRETSAIHTQWKMQHAYLMQWEELHQCRSRISLKQSMDFNSINVRVIDRREVEPMMATEIADSKIYNERLQTQTSQLSFIRSSTSLLVDKSNLTCLICLSELEFPCSVLPCGHMYCTVCLDLLVSSFRKRSQHPVCPICHRHFVEQEVTIGDATAHGTALENQWGMKMGALVQLIRQIMKVEKQSAKILVYSQWEDSLIIIGKVLQACGIKVLMMTRKNYYESVQVFKDSPNIPVFLMQLQKGNNGLDMSIATHVVIFEPILSATMEAQAVGRVQRIGQKKPTVVHYLIVKGTIEDDIYSLFEKRQNTEVKKQGYGINERETLTGQEVYDLCRK